MKHFAFLFCLLLSLSGLSGCSKMDFSSGSSLSATVEIVSPNLTPAVNGLTYSAALSASGGSGNYTWSVNSGSLPEGMTLNSKTGVISGVTSTAGVYPFSVQVQDNTSPDQASVAQASLTVVPQLSAQRSTAAPTTEAVGQPYTAMMVVTGGVPPYSYSVQSGSLPAGTVLKGNVITGTLAAAGSFNFTVQISDSDRKPQTLSVPFFVTVNSPVTPLQLSAPAFPSGIAGQGYPAVTLTPSGGVPAYTWSIASGALPAGLTLSAAKGVISGAPTKAGTYSFSVQVQDTGSPRQSATVSGQITVAAASNSSTTPAVAQWYVRPDGGTRYSSNLTTGQCDGKADASYPGEGVNQHCAFNDVRWLYEDGSYNTGSNQGWIISGGDTVIIRGSLATGTTYRIGWNNPIQSYDAATGVYWGIAGDPFSSGMPVPPSGTAGHPTRILGENYGSCHTQTARTQLHGGYGVGSVINLNGAQYVDMECLDVTDFSSCGRSGQVHGCNANPGSLDDYAAAGISQTNTTSHVTLTDIRIHGTAGSGLYGPNGDGDVYSYIDIIGNAASGWNADNGTVGIGSALMQNFTISWNGCAEEYPLVHALPYNDCTDDNSGGYGDGFGTATLPTTQPWNISFDQGTVSYNTQDGLDALHLVGTGSSMTITRVTSYGNMGQQLKVGGAGGTIQNSVVVTSCNALRQPIPGTPAGYNTNLSDFCRAADTGILIATQDGSTTKFDFNTIYSSAATGIEVICGGTCQNGTDLVDFRDNIFLGFLNSTSTGYVGGGTNDYSNPVYLGGINPFTEKGSYFDHNVTWHPKSNWTCPNAGVKETNGKCIDPGLVDESWHNYGIGTMSPLPGLTNVVGQGVSIPGVTVDIAGQTRPNPPSIGAYE